MKTLTILGTSASLWSDIGAYGVVGDVLAVNKIIEEYPGNIKYAISLHNDLLNEFISKRKANGYNTEDVTLFNNDHPCAAKINTSGLFALQLSQLLDYDEVRVLGISADNSGHYYDSDCTNHTNFAAMFPFDNEDWIPIFKSWSNIKVASGNLLRLFPKLNTNSTRL